MPWDNIKAAKEAGAHTELNGCALTIGQINAMAAQADAIDENTNKPIGWPTATKTFLETHEIKDGKWIEKKSNHAQQVIKFEDVKPLPTVDIPHVEIFQKGSKTDSDGHTINYTESDISAMAKDSNKVYQEHEFQGPVKLGHDENQPDTRDADGIPDDGHPAFGELCNFVAESGGRLFCDLKHVPLRLAELIKSGAYKWRSAEIIHSFRTTAGEKFKHVIAGLALLGKTHPSLSTLSDIKGCYKYDALTRYETYLGGTPSEPVTISTYSIDVTSFSKGVDDKENNESEVSDMTPEQQKEMEDKMKKFESDLKACMEENKGLKSKLKKYEDSEDSEEEKDKSKKFEDENSKLEAEKSAHEEEKKKFAKLKEELEAEKKSMHEANKKDFFKLHAKRFLPIDLKAQELAYDAAAADGKLDEFKSEFSKRPESGIFSEYAAPVKDLAGDPSAKPEKKDEEEVEENSTSVYSRSEGNKKASQYCKEHGLDPDDSADWGQALMATGDLGKYEKPLPLGDKH